MWFLREGVVVFQRTFIDCGTNLVQTELMKRLSVDADVAEHLFAYAECESGPGKSLPQTATVQAQIARYVDGLAEDLEASFAYINHRYNDAQPPTLFAIGGGATSGGVREALSARLNMPIDALAPMKLAECRPQTLEKCSSPILTTALGLALYEGE